MWNWFTPKLPIEIDEKLWVELRMAWLIDQFGIQRLRNAEVVLPTRKFFPEPYEGREADVFPLFRRVCGYMGIADRDIDVEFLPDDDLAALGKYFAGPPARIGLARRQLGDQEGMIGTIAHELAHHILLGEPRLTGTEEDHELTTDLLPTFLGVGIMVSNDVIKESTERMGRHTRWHASKQGYLTGRVHGYGLALFAWLRRETRPKWAKYLRLDVESSLKRSLHYLQRTSDALLSPDGANRLPEAPSGRQIVEQLKSSSATRRLYAMQSITPQAPAELRSGGGRVDELLEHLRLQLRDAHECLRCEAVRALASIAAAEPTAADEVMRALDEPRLPLRIAVVRALGKYNIQADGVADELSALLQETDASLISAVATSIAQLRANGLDTVPRLLNQLRQAVIDCQSTRADQIAAALLAIADNARALIDDYFSEDDDLRRPALESLERASQ